MVRGIAHVLLGIKPNDWSHFEVGWFTRYHVDQTATLFHQLAPINLETFDEMQNRQLGRSLRRNNAVDGISQAIRFVNIDNIWFRHVRERLYQRELVLERVGVGESW